MKRSRRSAHWWLQAAFTFLLVIIVLAPFGVVFAGAFLHTSFLGMSTEPWAGDAGSSVLSLHWFGYVWELYHDSFEFSLKLALLSTFFSLVIGVTGGYVLAHPKHPGGRLAETIVMLPLALPGIAVSIALIHAYSGVRGSWWLILGGHLLYTLPFMVRIVLNALRSFDFMKLEDSARGLGASFHQRFTMVTLPNVRQAMVAGSLVVFAVSWGEFNVSFLLNTPIHQTYPAALYATYTSNSFPVGSAATCIFLCGIVPILMALQVFGQDARPPIVQGG